MSKFKKVAKYGGVATLVAAGVAYSLGGEGIVSVASNITRYVMDVAAPGESYYLRKNHRENILLGVCALIEGDMQEAAKYCTPQCIQEVEDSGLEERLKEAAVIASEMKMKPEVKVHSMFAGQALISVTVKGKRQLYTVAMYKDKVDGL